MIPWLSKLKADPKRGPVFSLTELLVASTCVTLAGFLFIQATTLYMLRGGGGCRSALELSWWGWWIAPLQPYFSLGLCVIPIGFVSWCSVRRFRKKRSHEAN